MAVLLISPALHFLARQLQPHETSSVPYLSTLWSRIGLETSLGICDLHACREIKKAGVAWGLKRMGALRQFPKPNIHKDRTVPR